MNEHMTNAAKKAMREATLEAKRLHHEFLGTEHILLGLIKDHSDIVQCILDLRSILTRRVREETERLVEPGPEVVTLTKLPLTPRAKKVLEYADEERSNAHQQRTNTGHLMLGLLREQEGIGSTVLMNLGLKLEEAREEVLQYGDREFVSPVTDQSFRWTKPPQLLACLPDFLIRELEKIDDPKDFEVVEVIVRVKNKKA